MLSWSRTYGPRLVESLALLAPSLALMPLLPPAGVAAGVVIGLLLAIAALSASSKDKGLAYVILAVAAGVVASSVFGLDLLALSLPAAVAISLAALAVFRGSDIVVRTLLLLLPYHLLAVLVSLAVLGAPPHKLLSALLNPRLAPAWVPGGAVRVGLGIGFFTYVYTALELRSMTAALSLATGLGYAAVWSFMVADEGYPVGVSLAASAVLLPIILVDLITRRRFRG